MKSLNDSMGGSKSLLTDRVGYNGKQGQLLFALSILLHLGFLLGLVAAQNYQGPRVAPQAIQVNLVSYTPLPGQKNKTKGAEPVQEKPMAKPVESAVETKVVLPEKKKKKPPAKKQDISKKTKSTRAEPQKKKALKKKALKKKTYKPEKVLESARQTIAESLAKEDKDTLEKALSRLENQVEKNKRQTTASGVDTSNAGTATSTSRAIDLYNLELMYKIQQNWAFSERLAGVEKHMETRILIKLLKNGELRDVWFETRSGNRYLDESALKAVKKSAPFSPLPKGYLSYDVGLIFTPSGLK